MVVARKYRVDRKTPTPIPSHSPLVEHYCFCQFECSYAEKNIEFFPFTAEKRKLFV
jgi:hypothetical protein